MQASCNAIQESVAWSRALDEGAQLHLLDCESCRAFLEQMATLDAQMSEQADVDVPLDFADRVMAKVGRTRQPARRSAPSPRWRALEIALANVGLIIGLSNVLRFVLSVLVASTALGGPR
jgi:predicted anti-sigma-YlaC factor YlaD